MNPKVSIILVNYNGDKDTIDCVESLKSITYNNTEIIVVDNASKTQQELEGKLPSDVIYIKCENNLGFSGGNNLGINYAMEHNADYIMLLNNDTVVEKDFIEQLLDVAHRYSDVGIFTGKIVYNSRPDLLWYAGGYMNLNRARIHHLHIKEQDSLPDEEKEVSFATGCLMMMSRKAIEEVGVLNDIFFMYSEDAEYCARMTEAGYKIMYVSKAKIYHKVSASSGGAGSKLSQYYRTRNELYLVRHFAKNKVLGCTCCLTRYLKRIVVGQFTIKCVYGGLADLCSGRMGRTSRKF